MTSGSGGAADGPDDAASTVAAPHRVGLTVDLDVEVCVVGAGLAGLTVALEAARAGADVIVLEGRHVGWSASGHHLGTVMPGFALPLSDLIARVGFDDACELWSLSRAGSDYVRAHAAEHVIPGLGLSEGALEVSNVDTGERLISRLQMLAEDFATEVEGWQVDRVRDTLRTGRYFHAIHYPRAFQIDGRRYVHGLADLARNAGARIFEDTPVVSIDPFGIRKRIVTPRARLRASHLVLAGNIHLGDAMRRLSDTLVPVWRHAAVTAPLGAGLAEAVTFQGSVIDTDGIDHFRIVGGDRLMWAGPETTWDAQSERQTGAIRRRIRTIFPQLGEVEIAKVFSGAIGQTVHGMPQIGRLLPGLWVASGFGRQGLNTSAMAGQLVAGGMLEGDDRWRLFSPFELVWAGGNIGRAAGYAIGLAERARSTAAGGLARYRERSRIRARAREIKTAEASRQGGTRPSRPSMHRVPPNESGT